MTGRWLPKSWVVHVPMQQAQRFQLLTQAKEHAVSCGASGKWTRSVERTGPRQAEQIVYTDATP